MAESKDNATHLEIGPQSTAVDDIESKGYADAAIQKQNREVFDSTDEARRIERRYMRRLNLIVLPTISALYLFEYLDRGNVAVRPCLRFQLSSYVLWRSEC
jgi:hypothetical protein